MRNVIGLAIVCGACGTSPTSGDDVVDPPPPGTLSAIERCVIDGGAISEAWSVSNQHGPVTSIVAGSLIVLGGEDGSVKQWSIDGGDDPSYGAPFATAGAAVRGMALSSDAHILAVTDFGEIAEWRLSDAGEARTNTIADIEPAGLAVNAAATHAIVGTTTGQVFSVERTTGTRTQLASTLWGVASITYSETSLFTAGHWYSVPHIERRAADAPATVVDEWQDKMRMGWVRAIAVDGDTLVAAGDGFVAVFAANNLAAGPTAIMPTELAATGVTLLPGGALFATSTASTIEIYKTATGERLTGLATPATAGIARDMAGTRLYTSGADGRLHAFGCN